VKSLGAMAGLPALNPAIALNPYWRLSLVLIIYMKLKVKFCILQYRLYWCQKY